MATISEFEARRVVAAHERMLYSVVSNAWKQWLGQPPTIKLTLARPTPRANFLAALMYGQALQFEDHRGVKLIERYNTVQILLDGTVLVRFKKLDQFGVARNYPTQRSLAYDSQLPLEGVPSVARIDVGYAPNALGTEIAVLASHRIGEQVKWCFEIKDSTQKATVLNFPTSTASTQNRRTSKIEITGAGSDNSSGQSRTGSSSNAIGPIQPPDDDSGA